MIDTYITASLPSEFVDDTLKKLVTDAVEEIVGGLDISNMVLTSVEDAITRALDDLVDAAVRDAVECACDDVELRVEMSVPMRPDDPAYWMLFDEFTSTPAKGVYDPFCYICRDPEFAQMGLPLCRKCPKCSKNPEVEDNGHIPADDDRCTVCSYIEGEH
jgi:hypothetical protein